MNTMSKDNPSNNLRLLGSPVNLSYRCKKKDDKKNIRNRPRSAMQNSCITPDIQERHRRPFSADAKEHIPPTRTFLKTFSAELMHSLNNSPNNIKVLAPTADLLRDTKSCEIRTRNRDICSNTSDHGSEDTFISLGTKIKARAQSPKGKNSSCKNFIKYRNIAKKGKKAMDNITTETKNTNNVFGLEVKIIERRPSLDDGTLRNKNIFQNRTPSPTFMNRSYESYYLPLDNNNKKINEESLAGRVSFGQGGLKSEVEEAIDTYSRHLNVTKQQLSLVEEESTQDIESVPSQNASSLSPENSLKDHKDKDDDTGRATYVVDGNHGDYAKNASNNGGPRTYSSFYDDFQSASIPSYKMSSTVVHHDTSSKDSGYTDSGGTNDDKPCRRRYSIQNKNAIYKKSKMNTLQPKSLESIPLSEANEEKYLNTFPPQKSWTEPLNHSRLLYKDFFLKKEGHIALPPHNSPKKTEIFSIPGTSESIPIVKSDDEDKIEYPSYLLHSDTKTYTSRVIEDYKKEIEAINNLHELTLKDIQTDSISPTPLNIDKMFDQHSHFSDNKTDSNENSQGSSSHTDPLPVQPKPDKNTDNTKNDISKVSTEELIQNYLKVKSGDYSKDYVCKQFKKFEKKMNNTALSVENGIDRKHGLNNKNNVKNPVEKSTIASPIRNTIPSRPIVPTVPTKVPLSARLDSVQNDKDIESWMSMSAPSPSILDIEDTPKILKNPDSKSSEKNADNPQTTESTNSQNEAKNEDKPKVKDLNSGSTVLDIYSMLKEIESFGDHPVTSVVKADTETPRSKEDDKCNTHKDNFAEIFEFLEKVEESANDALSGVTTTTPQTIPKLEALLKLPQTELAQRLVTSLLQLDERSCCIALLQESLANHKEQMFNKVSALEKQSHRSISKVKQDCEEAVKRHQNFIDQLINDKKTLNHRIEQLVDERRAMEERWRRAAQTLEERHQLELRAQRDRLQAQQQVARQRWVRQKAEKIKELTVKGLEGELREMADRQQKEITDLKMVHAETLGRAQSKHAAALEELRRELEEEREAALVKERQLAGSRMEKQILELEATYREQRARLVAEMRAESERAAAGLCERERGQRKEIEKWREEQEKILEQRRVEVEREIAKQREQIEDEMKQKRVELEQEFETYKKEFEASQQAALKARVTEMGVQHKRERDREIEKAIESMEAEAQAGRRELQDALRRNKEQYEMELRELAETEQATLRRYQDAQARVRQTEDKCAELEVTINQLQTRNKVLTEKTVQLEQRAEEVRGGCERAWSGKVEALQKEMEDMKKTHEEHMHQLYAKVKVAVARKDSAIQALTREAAKYQEKITMLEQKLQQQRKDFLKHK